MIQLYIRLVIQIAWLSLLNWTAFSCVDRYTVHRTHVTNDRCMKLGSRGRLSQALSNLEADRTIEHLTINHLYCDLYCFWRDNCQFNRFGAQRE